MALVMVLSVMPFSIFMTNAEGESSVSVETRAGQNESVDVGETVTTDENGVKTTVRTAEDYTTASGMIVDYTGTNVEQPTGLYKFEDHYTSQDANDTYEAEGGSDKSNEYCAPASEIGLRIGEDDAGKSNTVTGEPVKVIETTGDVKENDADGIYDYTVKERITQSVIKVTTKSLSITDSHGAVNPDDMEYVHSDLKPDYSLVIDDGLDLVTRTTSNKVISQLEIPPADDVVALITGDYQYVNLESDQVAAYWPGWLFSSPQSETDNHVYEDEVYKLYGVYNNNHLRRKTFYLPDHRIVSVVDDAHPNGIGIRWDNVWFYTLADKHKNVITTYCADQRTPSDEFALYRIYNLEDAEYYEEEHAKHIRAIGNKGYWGLEGGESEFGTLAAVKKLMRDSGQFTDEQIEALTPGMAMCATQMAIWSYSNIIKDDMTFVNVHHVLKNGSITPASYHAAEEPDPDKAELIMRLYWLLHDLEPEAIPEDDATTENTIINEKSFLKSVNLTITDKPADHANNKDADKTNDVYDVDLEIAFKVKPLEENGDDLVLEIQDQNGDPIVKARIAGPNQEGEVPASVVEDGTYKIEGIQLQEGEKALKFALSGTQNLRNDVYFFNSEDEDGTIVSQPMVGVASGKRDVNIWMDLTFELDVTDEELKEEHFWRTEQTYIEIPVEKDWQDAVNQDGVRPEKITVHLLADGVECRSAEIRPDANGDWKYTFTKVPQYTEDGTREIVYTITEDPVPEYDAPEYVETSDGLKKIVNKHEPVLIEIPVTKEWADGENTDGARPESITVRLYADGTETDSATIVPDEDGLWKHTFTDLPKFRDQGVEIVYTISEDEVPEYQAEIDQGTYTITNKHDTGTVDVSVTKEWEDEENVDGVRPDSITVHLLADGTEVDSATIVPDEDGHWEHTFKDLPKYRDHGVEIVYTITEDPVREYETEIDQGTYTITNKHEPEKTVVEGKKTWIDNDNYEKKRPVWITIRLYADGVMIDSKVVTKADGWKWTFPDLPKYKDGKVITYTIKEDRVAGYVSKIVGYDIYNTYAPPTGDTSDLWLWATVFALSLLAGFALLAIERMYGKRA